MKTLITNLITTEPAMVGALVQYAIVLMTLFNFNMNDTQAASLIGFSTLLFAILTRQAVTPNVKVPSGDA